MKQIKRLKRTKIKTGTETSFDSKRKVDIGVRPEHFGISTTGEGITARVILVEPTGSETLVSCQLDETTLLVNVKERIELAPGDIITLSVASGCHHFFDHDSGEALVVE